MTNRTVYALKGSPEWAANIHESLKKGEARFGWSYVESADLRKLAERIATKGWKHLNPDEQACYKHFLLGVAEGDYLVYINVPTYGQCTLARVTKPYYWRWETEDFNHRLGVDPASVKTFGRNDNIVHPALAARLKLQGAWWRIYADPEFDLLLAHLDKGTKTVPSTPADNLAHLAQAIDPRLLDITKQVQHTHPNYSLERLLEEVFKNVPGVKEVHRQGGAGDKGADLLIVVEEGHVLTTPKQTTCVVQVKSYTNQHSDTQAVEDIRRAFKNFPQAGAGIIFSTAESAGPELDTALEKLRTELNKPVKLIIGAEVALFILRYGAHLISRSQLV